MKQIRYTATTLLLLYVAYFGCVSYFVHKHVYQGVTYIHSHPYTKANPEGENTNEPPFETHKHTSAGFFTLNQLSSHISFAASESYHIERLDNYVVKQYIDPFIELISRYRALSFRHRAPPII